MLDDLDVARGRQVIRVPVMVSAQDTTLWERPRYTLWEDPTSELRDYRHQITAPTWV
jgi:hypothetical protein